MNPHYMNPHYVIMDANNNYYARPLLPNPPVQINNPYHHPVIVPPPPFCERCGMFGHKYKHCKETHNIHGIEIENTLCVKCGLHGHLSQNCRSNPKRKFCEKCSRFGHLSDDCSYKTSVYGDDLCNHKRCTRCNYFGHTKQKCKQKRTSGGELIVKSVGAERALLKFESDENENWYDRIIGL